MKNVTLKLTLLTLIAGTALVPQHADAMNWKKWLTLGAVGAGLMYAGYKIIKYNQKKLLFASESGDIETVKHCLYYGAHLNTKDNHGRTPLMWACNNGYTNIVQYLVENGAYINTQDNYGYTPLMLACNKELIDIAQYLVKNGAHLNTKDKYGYTPLMWACINGHTNIAQYLIKNGAHLNTQNNNNQTAYDIAVQRGKQSIAQYLLEVQNELNIFKINPLQLTTFAPKSTFIKMLYNECIYYINTSTYTDLCSIFAKFQNNHNELKIILDDCKFLQYSKEEIKKLNKNGFPLDGQELIMQENFIKNIKESNFFDLNMIYRNNTVNTF